MRRRAIPSTMRVLGTLIARASCSFVRNSSPEEFLTPYVCLVMMQFVITSHFARIIAARKESLSSVDIFFVPAPRRWAN